MYVYQTEPFADQVQAHRLGDRLVGFLAALEEHPDIHPPPGLVDPVGPYWKRRVERFRVVCRPLRVDDVPVVCMLEIFERKDANYDKFIHDPKEFGHDRWARLLGEDVIGKWLAAQKVLVPELISLKPLPDDLAPWLDPPKWVTESRGHDVVVYETEEWMARFRRREIQDYWQTYHEIVLEALDKADVQEVPEWKGVALLQREDGRGIIYSRFETDAGRTALLLVAPVSAPPSDAELGALLHGSHPVYWEEDPISPDARVSMDDLARFARRSYPDFVLYDSDVWLDIERETEANLALSAEEEQVLQSVSLGTADQATLPIFINGRAGSGKSTMLLHLFAEFCHRKAQEGLAGEPLFLTYNERLLQVAREGVQSLLSSHHHFVAARGQADEVPDVEANFQPFQKFLLSLLPPSERGRFAPESHIGFHAFKLLFSGRNLPRARSGRVLQLPQARTVSPELCWHAIRSFIKGYSAGDLVTPEEYEEIPRRDRSISDEVFRLIFETIWKQWYSPLTTEDGFWDDQDLVRRVLDLECYVPRFTAIVCDEAQDFTRIELQLIMRLSQLAQYDLSRRVVHCLPFAFAGDPSQTLNPTGFRWASLRASFYDEVITSLDPSREWDLSMNLQDLIYNYRSKGPIVKLINVIQLWRHALFGLSELRPQLAWSRGEFLEPQKFILGTNLTSQELQTRAADTIILVPCEEGQERDYVEGDEVLSAMIPLPQDGSPPKNVLSAPSAKGLEFQRVILYKFGDACVPDVWRLDGSEERQKLESEYFFNKLYVAASRAMTRLFVVDSPEGDAKLWSRAETWEELALELDRAEGGVDWRAEVQPLMQGTPESLTEMHEDDPRSVAFELKRKGRALRNPSLLRRARAYFAMLGIDEEAAYCEASALTYEEMFLEAGELFARHGYAQEAGEAFWAGMCWEKLLSWHSQNVTAEIDSAEGASAHFASFMVARGDDTEAIEQLIERLERHISAAVFGERAIRQWRRVTATLSERLARLSHDALTSSSWSLAGKVLERLSKSGFLDSTKSAGDAFFRATNFYKAVECWESAAETTGQDYFLAKAAVVGFPENLLWLERARDPERIIEEWERSGPDPSKLQSRSLRIIARALEERNRDLEAFHLFRTIRDTERMLECLRKAEPGARDADVFEALKVLTLHLIEAGEWPAIAETIGRYWPRFDKPADPSRDQLALLLAREVGQSNLTPDMLAEPTKDVLARVLGETSNVPEWRRDIRFQELASAFERVGHLISALRFYEQFFDDLQPSVRSLARERWLTVKLRQAEGARDSDTRERLKRERANRRHDWGISESHLESLPPFPAVERIAGDIEVEGLLSDEIEHLPDGNIRFHLGSLEVRTFRQAGRILITEVETSEVTRIDLRSGRVDGNAEAVESSVTDEVEFTSPSGYSGTVRWSNERAHVSLTLSDLTTSISIRLPPPAQER
jgi:hypothetical protein